MRRLHHDTYFYRIYCCSCVDLTNKSYIYYKCAKDGFSYPFTEIEARRLVDLTNKSYIYYKRAKDGFSYPFTEIEAHRLGYRVFVETPMVRI